MATNDPRQKRARRKRRIRKKVVGTAERPRLSVYRSNKHIYAQVIDDSASRSVVGLSDRSEAAKTDGDKTARARALGLAIAKLCQDKGITKVVFDRNGYKYHGRVRALAEGAREGGLEF